MLHLLLEYARKEELNPEPGFTPKEVRWAVRFTSGGQFNGVVEIGDVESKKNRGREFRKCPDLGQPEMKAEGITKSHFLVDTVDVIALLGKDTDDKKTIDKRETKHNYFVNLLRRAGDVMPELAMLAEKLADPETVSAIRDKLEEDKAKPADKVTFHIGSDYPVESDAWHDWWRSFRKTLAGEKSKKKTGPTRKIRCFATGELVEPAATHPKVKGLSDVGGLSMGDVLIGFKQDSFCSYGFKQSANAAVSEEAAAAYTAALNHLVSKTGYRLAGAKVVHWFKKKIQPENDPLSFLTEGKEAEKLNAQQRAKELLQSIRSGERPDLSDNFYYAVTLSGASGRVMVRDWMEGQFKELAQNISTWFKDVEIFNYEEHHPAKPPGIERVITCLLPEKKRHQKYKDWIKPVGAENVKLWRAAVRGELISHNALLRLVELDKKFRVSGTFEEAKKNRKKNPRRFAEVLSLVYTRMGLMKAYHIRKNRFDGGGSMSNDLKPYLNEEHPDPAYQCGRLMAVLAGLQYAALGDVGAGVVQRYYAAASCTPALVFGRIIKTGQHHLCKLDGGLAHWYEKMMSEISCRIGDEIPRTLELKKQSLFALGYYQQMARMRTKKSDNQNEKGGENNE